MLVVYVLPRVFPQSVCCWSGDLVGGPPCPTDATYDFCLMRSLVTLQVCTPTPLWAWGMHCGCVSSLPPSTHHAALDTLMGGNVIIFFLPFLKFPVQGSYVVRLLLAIPGSV